MNNVANLYLQSNDLYCSTESIITATINCPPNHNFGI